MSSKLSALLLCDDVRKEVSGKDIIIGVFSDKVLVNRYPATVRMALWMEFENESVGTTKNKVRIETPSGNEPIEIEFDMDVAERGSAMIALNGLPFHFERDGQIIISLKIGEDDWFIAKKKMVMRVSPPPTGG